MKPRIFPLIETKGRIAFFDDQKESANSYALSMRSKFEAEAFNDMPDAKLRLQKASDALNKERRLLRQILKYESPYKILLEAARWIYNRKVLLEVCFCDYDMPYNNGVQVFNSINECSVRRVILTGMAGPEIAVHAFNDKSIDVFLTKNQTSKEIEEVARLGALRPDFHDDLDEEFGDILQTEVVASSLKQYLDSREVEQYLVLSRPMGILTKNKSGQVHWHHIETESSLPDTLDVLKQTSEDKRLISRVASGEIGVCFDLDEALGTDPDEVTQIEMTEISDSPWMIIGKTLLPDALLKQS